MKKILFGTMFLALVIFTPIPTMAGVNISFGISLPPPIVFASPPEVIVIPDTDDVYVVPAVDVDIFFWNGWWGVGFHHRYDHHPSHHPHHPRHHPPRRR